MRPLLIALTLTSTAAWSQTYTLELTAPNNADEIRVGMNSCDLVRAISFSHNITVVPCTDLQFAIVKGSCPENDPDENALELDEIADTSVPTSLQGSREFTVSDLPDFRTAQCPVADQEVKYKFCAWTKTRGGAAGDCSATNLVKDEIDIVYDSKPPAAPTIESVMGLDSALSIQVEADDDVNQVKVVLTRADGTGTPREIFKSVDQLQFRVDRLENGVTYRVVATALDEAENESAASNELEGTPVLTRGFFDRYVESGGQEMGGCAAAGGLAGGWVLMAALGFWLSSRRNRS